MKTWSRRHGDRNGAERPGAELAERSGWQQVDFTVIPSDDGTLLPRNWPKPYHPIHRAAGDHSVIQSHLIETWAMSWWGFEKGGSAMMVIVETPDDAALYVLAPGRRTDAHGTELARTA